MVGSTRNQGYCSGTCTSTRLSLQWRHNERDGDSNHRRLHCLPNRLFRRTSKTTSKLRVTGLCEGNPPVPGGFPSQRASNTENIFIRWRHHDNHTNTQRNRTLSIFNRISNHNVISHSHSSYVLLPCVNKNEQWFMRSIGRILIFLSDMIVLQTR